MAEDEAPNGYYTRRGIHAINVQAAADDRGRITWASLRAPGGMHDGQACSLSDLFSILVAGAGCWFFVGDDAYVGKPYMATPFGGTPATGSKARAPPPPARLLPDPTLTPSPAPATGGQLQLLPGAHTAAH